MKMKRVPFLITETRRRNPYRRAPRYKVTLVKEAGSVYVSGKRLHSARAVFEATKDLFEGADREMFFALCLDQKRRIIGINLVAVGTLYATLIHPREAFKAAILLNSAAVIFIHNHPSGSAQASPEDAALTKRLVIAGLVVGIPVEDSIVFGEDSFYSLAESGLIPAYEAVAKGRLYE